MDDENTFEWGLRIMCKVTPEFIEEMIHTGYLAKAQARALNGTSQPENNAQWDRFSTWTLICEEIRDTELSPNWYDDILAELKRRGFDIQQINRMRRFAWQTAGWLNYEKMAWEWGPLDQKDIETAIDWQFKDGLISNDQHKEAMSYLIDPKSFGEPGGSEIPLCEIADNLFQRTDQAEFKDANP